MKIQHRFKSHQSLRIHCKKQTQNKCEICSHEFCTATELNAHRKQQGCEGLIELSLNILDTKVILVEVDSEQYDMAATSKEPSDHLQIAPKFDDNNRPMQFGNSDATVETNVIQSYKNEELTKSHRHVCKKCGQHFTQRRSLLQHGTIHTNERPFECWLCHKL